MKAILEFNLPEEKSDFNFATQGLNWWSVCWEMDQWLRGEMKHPSGDMSDDTYEALQKCREKLSELIYDSNLNLDQ